MWFGPQVRGTGGERQRNRVEWIGWNPETAVRERTVTERMHEPRPRRLLQDDRFTMAEHATEHATRHARESARSD